jgi:tRNA threonylcarbamoyl adenosine modification protein YeaZ
MVPSNPLILAFDTSAAHCAAALLLGDTMLAARAEEMTRGQAERLMPLLEEILAEHNKTWRDLTAIGVGVGPGNFTGIRIGVSAARGLALALDIPAIGVSTFDAISYGATTDHAAAVPAPRDQLYLAVPGTLPRLITRDEAASANVTLLTPPKGAELAQRMAQITLMRHTSPQNPPAPLYIRAADAAPSRDTPPVMLSDDT